MYCKNCGKQLDDDASFCKYCGTRTDMKPSYESNDESVKKQKDESQNNLQEVESVKEEETISILKQNYLESAFSGSGLEKNYIKLTNNRLYVKGRVISRVNKSFSKLTFGTKDIAIPLHQITGVEIHRLSFVVKKLLATIFLLIGTGAFIPFITELEKKLPGELVIYSFLTMLIFIPLGIAQLVDVVKYGNRIFIIHHYGGPTQVLVRWYSESKLIEFRKKLMNCIDVRK